MNLQNRIIHKDWHPILNLLHQEPMIELRDKILPEISYEPDVSDIFRVFNMPLKDIKVVILGQDPYPTPNIANGLAFAVNEDSNIPVSLKIIAQEIAESVMKPSKEVSVIEQMKPMQFVFNTDLYKEWRTLQHWKDQGVFLLNTALTVETGKPGSHLKYWEDWTKRVISHISINQPCIWLLWGSKAQKFAPYIKGKMLTVSGYTKETIDYLPSNPDWNYVLNAAHPAAESYNTNAGFFGCNHFYYVNSILKNKSQNEIKW